MNMNNWDFNLEDKITWDELAPSLQALFKKLQKMIEDEIARAKDAENKLNIRINNIWGSDGEKSTHDITEIWKNLGKLKKDVDDAKKTANSVADTISKNLDITLGTFGASNTSTPEYPNQRTGNNIGDQMKYSNENGDFIVYRHTTITTKGSAPDEEVGYNGYKNIKSCQANDYVTITFPNPKKKDFYISVPTVIGAYTCLDIDGNLILALGNINSKLQCNGGGYIKQDTAIVYSSLNKPGFTINKSSYNGTIVNIYQVSLNSIGGVLIEIDPIYTVFADDYKLNRTYSAQEITTHFSCPRPVNLAGATATSGKIAFVDDERWCKLIHCADTVQEIKNKLQSV